MQTAISNDASSSLILRANLACASVPFSCGAARIIGEPDFNPRQTHLPAPLIETLAT